MSFLQPWLLVGLPLIAIPIIIHLINQQRYQSIRWGAMMFLLAANRLSRGYSRLRQWLILAARTLAVAGLIFAVSRPLSSGWLGHTVGGQAETTLILLDRSPSMEQSGQVAGQSKRQTGLEQLVRALELLPKSRYVLIESTRLEPIELSEIKALTELPEAGPATNTANVPGLFEAALDYIRRNRPGRTEVWLSSDLRSPDWHADSGRWPAIRSAFLEMPLQVRFHLLAYPRTAAANMAIRVTRARRIVLSDRTELAVSFVITREGATEPATIPVQFEIGGARSQASFEITGDEFEVQDYRVALESSLVRGWGRLALPADSNPADDDAYFVFEDEPARQTLIVTDDPQATRPFQIAASVLAEPGLKAQVSVLSPDQLAGVEWEQLAAIVWATALPTAGTAEQLNLAIRRGATILLVPPTEPNGESWNGFRWTDWRSAEQLTAEATESSLADNSGDATAAASPRPATDAMGDEGPRGIPVTTWRSDQDLLSRTRSGAALPVGQLSILRACGFEGESTPLASLIGDRPLLARLTMNSAAGSTGSSAGAGAGSSGGSLPGTVYALATTARETDSSLATQGVVLYAMLQRAIHEGVRGLGLTRSLIAGELPAEASREWQVERTTDPIASHEAVFQRGAYRLGDLQLVVNRQPNEDHADVLEDATVSRLFEGLDLVRVDDEAGSVTALIQEVWRAFLLVMMVALIGEAALCLPKTVRSAVGGPTLASTWEFGGSGTSRPAAAGEGLFGLGTRSAPDANPAATGGTAR